MKFNTNDAISCSSETKTQLSITQELERQKEQLLIRKSEMKILSNMFGAYLYNREHLTEMVGACYIDISNLKTYIRINKKLLKDFK